ncbi:hypothetical protein CRE_09314 [Caenorhabditis remanei]|uniref:Seven TM Receptor n=1 Tax=Caenorhabditis remanei TaxID=31234 RepID=E3LI40_CAERE|nr:hypothetical protein CRE_09314 [Caenorhabditis remanei]
MIFSSQNYVSLISVTNFVPQIGFVSSIFFGLILLILNYHGAQKMFGSYKFVISAFTMLGMLFATAEIIVYPNAHNYKAGMLFFSFTESFGLSGSKTKNLPLVGYTFIHSATMSLLSVQFIYRYWAVFDVNKLQCFKGWKSVIWYIYCSFFGFQYAVFFLYWAHDEFSPEYFREEVLLRYNANISSFPAISCVAYDPVDGSVRWWNVIGIINVCSVMIVQYGVMIYCGWSMHTKMADKIKHFSKNLRKLHEQLFKTLVLQITAPTLTLFLPASLIMLLPILNLDISIPSGVMLCSFTLYPAMDSITVMYVVSEYRITAKKIFKVIRKIIIEINQSRTEPTAPTSAS